MVRKPLIHCFLGGEVGLSQRLRASELGARKIDTGHRRRKLSCGKRKFDFVGTRIDDEQEIALSDDLTVLKMNLREDAADLRAQFNAIYRRELPEKS